MSELTEWKCQNNRIYFLIIHFLLYFKKLFEAFHILRAVVIFY